MGLLFWPQQKKAAASLTGGVAALFFLAAPLWGQPVLDGAPAMASPANTMASMAQTAPLENPYPQLAPSYLVLLNGQPLWAAQPEKPMAPASLIKLLAALVALQDYRPDEWVAVSRQAAARPPAKLGLRAGERVRQRDLLAAMLIRSANDACAALAERHGPGQAAFVAKMNSLAKALGLQATQVGDPCGFDTPGQQSTARDLARLAQEAARHPEIHGLVARQQMRLATQGGRSINFRNGNALLRFVPGADGMKTGYTSQAGRCLILTATRGEDQVLVVMLGSPNRWWGAIALAENAFATLSGQAQP